MYFLFFSSLHLHPTHLLYCCTRSCFAELTIERVKIGPNERTVCTINLMLKLFYELPMLRERKVHGSSSECEQSCWKNVWRNWCKSQCNISPKNRRRFHVLEIRWLGFDSLRTTFSRSWKILLPHPKGCSWDTVDLVFEAVSSIRAEDAMHINIFEDETLPNDDALIWPWCRSTLYRYVKRIGFLYDIRVSHYESTKTREDIFECVTIISNGWAIRNILNRWNWVL